MNFTIAGPHLGEAAVCIPIVRSLPEWFGIEEAIDHYSAEIDHLPTFLASNPEGVSGFLSLKQHSPYAAEVYVMGVRCESHRAAAQQYARSLGIPESQLDWSE